MEKEKNQENKEKNKKCMGKSHKIITSILFTTMLILIMAISFACGFLMCKCINYGCNTETVLNTVEKIKEEEKNENQENNLENNYIEANDIDENELT